MASDDITHCLDRDCPLREHCQRYVPPITNSLVFGSFYEFSPRKADGTCGEFLEERR